MTREITHMKVFTAALESMDKPAFTIGKIPPSKDVVDLYFNDSTGEGHSGDMHDQDAVGPWNDGKILKMTESPVMQDLRKRL